MESHPLQDRAQDTDTAELQHAKLSRSVACLLAETATLGSNLAHAAPTNGTVSGLEQIDSDLGTYFSHTYELGQRLKRQTFTVAVLALAKSGKSTFLNAITGHPILPVNNIPETARICRITHTPLGVGEQVVLYDRSKGSPAETVIGETAIRQHLTLLNREVRTRQHQLHDEVMLDVQLPITALAGRNGAAEDVAIQLLDTPGPNESGEEALRYQVERLLDSVDAVIYLLDYTKLRTAEEASIFERIKSINPGLVKRLSRRLFFVVNKMDTIRLSEGLDEDATREYVAALVTEQLSGEGFQLRPDQVLLVSAQEALLSRLMLRQEPAAAPEVARRFKERAFGSSRAVQRKTFSPAELQAAAQDMVEDSGIQEAEASVFGFLYSHAGVLKLMAIVDDLARTLNQMANSVAVSEGALMKDMAVLQDEAMALQKTLEDTLARFDEVQAQTATLEEEVVDEVRTRLGFLRERLVDHVVAVLDSAAADNERAAPTGHWRAVFDKARAFLGRRAAGADRAELQQTLSELHNDIFTQIDQEVRGFWHQLETATNDRQRALLRRLNMHLEGLSRAIEAVVSERLSVRLEPVDLRLKPPSAQEFHDSLQRLFATGITQKNVVKERSREVEFTQWEKRYRNGICRTGEYYVGHPSKRTVQEQYTVTEYEIQPEKIKEYFCELIGTQIEASVRSVRAFVKQYLAATIDEARSSITTYAERFTSCMLSALATSEQGEKARLAALEHVRGHKEGLAKLLAEAATLQAEAEAMFPKAVASMSRAPSLEFDDGDFLPAEEEPTFEPQVSEEVPLPDAPPYAATAPTAAPDERATPAQAADAAAVNATPSTPRAAAEPLAASGAASSAGSSSPGGTAAVVYGDRAVCLLCGGADHWTDGCGGASKSAEDSAAAAEAAAPELAAPGAAASDAVMAEGPAADMATATEEDGSVVSGAADNSTTGAAAASPRSSRSDGEEEDQYGDAASSLGGSFYQAGVPDAVLGAASSVGGSFCHAGAESAEADAAETFDSAARQPTSGAPAPPQAADKGFVADVDGQTVTSGPAEAEPPAPTLAGSDAFSGVALGGSYASAAAASVSNVQLVAEPVPAHASAKESQEQPAVEDSDDAADAANDLATIPLGGNTPASPSAASAASEPSSEEDWTVVEDEHEEHVASARRQLSDPNVL